jgi:Xaa-Pro aminopeptidase
MSAEAEWPAELEARRTAVAAIVERNACEAALVFGSQGHGEHFRYLTNFAPVLGDMWLVAAEGRLVCVLDFAWQLEEARRRSGIEDWHGRLDAVEIVGEALAAARPERLAIAGLDRLPVTAWRRLEERVGDAEVVDVGAEVAQLRRRKSPLEVRLLREAARKTDEALDVARGEARPGVSERDLAARLGQALGPEWAFPPTVLGGNDDPIPIREPTERRLEAGDTVMVDLGAAHEGYQADASRTFVLGNTNAEQRRVWEAVSRAYDAAVAATRAGVPCVSLHEAAARAAEDSGYLLAHRIGHGIGLATSFEWPDLANEHAPLEPGVTICIEPGIAVPGAGVMKLEDDVLVTEDGCELLTHSERSLTVS